MKWTWIPVSEQSDAEHFPRAANAFADRIESTDPDAAREWRDAAAP